MNCENSLCIYEEDGVCILKSIEINMLGQCTECIYPNIEELLKKIKQETYDKLHSEM